MSKPKCQACGGTGIVTVYMGEGDFEFYECEWCDGELDNSDDPNWPDRDALGVFDEPA